MRGAAIEERIRELALSFPETYEDHPWGDTVVKASNKKIFLFAGEDREGRFCVSVKLPESNDAALSLGFTEPTGYGLGKAGWVSVRFKGVKPHLLEDFVEESYRNVATKTLIKELDART